MLDSYVFYQGKILEEEKVSISIRSKAFNYGLGCFEGIRAFWNNKKRQLYVFRIDDHYKRLKRSCNTLNINIPYSVDELREWTIQLLKKNNFKTDVYIRPVAYKGAEDIAPRLNDNDNRLVIYCQPLGEFIRNPELRVKTSSWIRITNNSIPPSSKPTGGYLNSALASLDAVNSGYDEAVFVTQNGYICEGPGENIFLYGRGGLITPPIHDDILEGITRETVKLLAKKELKIQVTEQSITKPELYTANEAFFTGTAIGIKPIVEVDGRIIGTGQEGDGVKI